VGCRRGRTASVNVVCVDLWGIPESKVWTDITHASFPSSVALGWTDGNPQCRYPQNRAEQLYVIIYM
jgi:hypothetical protein